MEFQSEEDRGGPTRDAKHRTDSDAFPALEMPNTGSQARVARLWSSARELSAAEVLHDVKVWSVEADGHPAGDVKPYLQALMLVIMTRLLETSRDVDSGNFRTPARILEEHNDAAVRAPARPRAPGAAC